jgi:alpha-aminoadipate carrier protein LysW
MATVSCPDCGQKISLVRAWEGQLITCSNCNAELEVISLDPPELDWAYVEPEEEEEYWDYVDQEEEEEAWDEE